MYQGSGVPVTMRKQPSDTPTATLRRYGEPQSPRSDGAARDLLGLEGHGDKRGFGHRRGEADSRGESVDQPVVAPVHTAGQTLRPNGLRPGELARHGLPDGEKRLFQSDKKQREAHQNEYKPGGHAARVWETAAQHHDLKQDQDSGYGRHVQHGGQDRSSDGVQESHRQNTML